MKKLMLMLFLLVSAGAVAQTGWVPYASKNRHIGLMADSLFYVPRKDTSHTPQRVGGMTVRPQDSALYVAVSTTAAKKWEKIAKYSDITADTVLNYTQLRAYAGAAKILILTDSVRGGTFYYTGESENGATVIDGWRRVFDGKHYKPEWFEIGGKDMNGASYNRLTGTGIGSWGKAIAQICRLAGPDAIIDYKPGFQYPVDRLIPIKQNQTHKGGYLKRAAPVWTLLSNNEAIGSTSIEVADASSLQAGMLFLIKGAGTDGSHGDNSNGTTGTEWHEILSISGNTLTISGSVYRIEKAMLAGDTLITVAPLLYRENSILGASDSDYIVKCKDMTFDGNYSQNNKIIDYQQPATIEMFGGYVIADNCTFKNIPGENIYTTGGYVTNCVANNLQGSFAHGTNNLQTIDSLYQEFVVVNLKADSVGLGTAELQGHSEAILWVNSTKTANSKWIDCTVTNSGMTGRGKALWSGNADDGIVQVIRGTYKKARGIMDLSGCDSTTAKGSRVLIQDAKFNNCGWLQIAGSGNETRRDNGLKDVGVYRNTFINTRAYFDGIAGLDVIGNKFYSDSSTNIFNDTRASGTGTSSTFLGTGQQTMLLISAYTDRVNFQDNYVEGFKNDSIMTGLTIVINDSVYRKESTAMTDYYYGQDFNISGNTINNFRYLMSFSQTTFAKNVVSWKIDNNDGYILYHPDYSSDYTYGIMIPPGASGNNNTCSTPYNNNYSFPFIVYGVKSTGNYAKLIGGQLSNSRAYGKANYPINADPFNTTPYNIVLKSNTAYYGTIRWGTDANLYKLGDVDNNVFTNATLSNYQPPKKFRIGENKTNY